MAAINRYSVAKTQRSYDPAGLGAVLGSTVYSSTEAWVGGNAYGEGAADEKAKATPRVPPTS